MKILDILFMPSFLVLLYLFSSYIPTHPFTEMQTIYIAFAFIVTQIALSFKYKFDEIRWIIIFLVTVGAGEHLLLLFDRSGISATALILTLLMILTYSFAFLIYLYSFILKPIYLRIKKLSIR